MNNLIELKDITFSFPGVERPLFDDLNFEIKKGESIGIVGTNGTGKSTLMKILATLVRPNKGEYFYKNELLNKNLEQARCSMNYVVGGSLGFYPRLNAVENLKFFSGLKGDMVSTQEAVSILNKVQLKENDFSKKCFQYSLGMKQRLHIAKLFLGNPEVLFIDEPTNGLDAEGQTLLLKLLNEDLGNLTKVIISHDSDFLRSITKHTLRINNGKIINEN